MEHTSWIQYQAIACVQCHPLGHGLVLENHPLERCLCTCNTHQLKVEMKVEIYKEGYGIDITMQQRRV